MTMVFRGEASREHLGVDKVLRAGPPQLNPGGFLRSGRETRGDPHASACSVLATGCPAPPWNSASKSIIIG